jgi:hypothetical protein
MKFISKNIKYIYFHYHRPWNNNQYWLNNCKFHREDGPATIDYYGNTYWYKNHKFHREDGPAVILANDSKFWYKNGEYIKSEKK